MIKDIYICENKKWNKNLDKSLDSKNTLVLFFGSNNFDDIKEEVILLEDTFPNSIIVGNSTSGEIFNDELYEHSLSVAIIKFEKTNILKESINISNDINSYDAGKIISSNLSKNEKLKAIFILSNGLNINGSQLTKGLNLNNNLVITGGLAGDDDKFENTWVYSNKQINSYSVVAIGFYGDNFNISHSSEGGWSKFGINRIVTSSKNNILYELDNKPALEVYKTYLGELSQNLPSSALLYPLMIEEPHEKEYEKVRTILAINEKDQSITFAGDIPIGSKAMFMQASFSELINGASSAVNNLNKSSNSQNEELNIAISCVGRKLVLGQKTEDEIEVVNQELKENSLIGYYSYGEISPLNNGQCDLHNQTMTLTKIWES